MGRRRHWLAVAGANPHAHPRKKLANHRRRNKTAPVSVAVSNSRVIAFSRDPVLRKNSISIALPERGPAPPGAKGRHRSDFPHRRKAYQARETLTGIDRVCS